MKGPGQDSTEKNRAIIRTAAIDDIYATPISCQNSGEQGVHVVCTNEVFSSVNCKPWEGKVCIDMHVVIP